MFRLGAIAGTQALPYRGGAGRSCADPGRPSPAEQRHYGHWPKALNHPFLGGPAADLAPSYIERRDTFYRQACRVDSNQPPNTPSTSSRSRHPTTSGSSRAKNVSGQVLRVPEGVCVACCWAWSSRYFHRIGRGEAGSVHLDPGSNPLCNQLTIWRYVCPDVCTTFLGGLPVGRFFCALGLATVDVDHKVLFELSLAKSVRTPVCFAIRVFR